MWEQLTGEPHDVPRLVPRIVTVDGQPVETPCGLSIAPHAAMGEADVIIVTDLVLDPDIETRQRCPEQTGWIRQRYAAGAIVCSVCTGSVVLAETGLLDGLEAMTHWSMVTLMKRRYPAIRLVPKKILSPVGPGHRIITGGGATAWEELALYLVAGSAARPKPC